MDLTAFAEICTPGSSVGGNTDPAGAELHADLWDQVLSLCVQPGWRIARLFSPSGRSKRTRTAALL
eukprot:COSAG02_NODE_42943_length_379_cov_1.467857_1_plen_65_part_10